MSRWCATTPIRRLAAWLVLLVPSIAGAQVWQEHGPAPLDGIHTGRVSALVVSPSDPNRAFAGGADGGVWRTMDGGISWTPLTDEMPTTAIGALALDPSDENIVYAGTGEANFANHSRFGLGLYRSLDGGDSWTQLGQHRFAGRCIARILVSPADSQTLYVAVTRAGGFPEMVAAKGHPRADGPVGVFRSRDGGLTWRHLTTGLSALSATDLAMDPVQPSTLYAAIGRIFGDPENGIYRSDDGGDSWTKLGGGLPTSDVGRIALAVAPSDRDRLYALITEESNSTGGSASTRGIYRSSDGGANWTRVSTRNIQASYGWYLCVVAVDPADADTFFAGGLTLVRSTNAGGSFSDVTPPHVDLHALAFDSSGRLWAGDDGGVHRSDNLGSSWSSLNDGLGLAQFYAGVSFDRSDARLFFGGLQDNGTNRHDQDGKAWDHVLGGDGGFTQLDRGNSNRVFAEFQGTANLYRSTNQGNSFSWVGSDISSGDRNCFMPPYLIDPTDSGRMLYATHRIWRSTDGGSNWSAHSGDLTTGSGAIRALAQCESDPDTVWAVTNDGNVAVSKDGAANFTTVRSGHPGWPRVTREIAIHPDQPDEAYLATAWFGTEQILRTRDSGQSFEALDTHFPDLPVNTVAIDARTPFTVLYVGAERGVYRSTDDGASWARTGIGLPNVPVVDLQVDEVHARLIAATQGRGLWTLDLFDDREMHRVRSRR